MGRASRRRNERRQRPDELLHQIAAAERAEISAQSQRQADQVWAVLVRQMNAVFDAAHRQARRGHPLRFGVTGEPTQAVAVGTADATGKPLATAFVPLPMAIELLEDLATMAEAHGYGEMPREWRKQFPAAWKAVRERREREEA
jgi:hypothetical protein